MSFGGDLRHLVHGRDFRRLYTVRLASQSTDGIFQAGLAAVFFFSPERATDASGIAAAFAVLLLPFSVVGPFAGVLLDRWSRRQVLVWANLTRSAMVVGVALLVARGTDGIVLYAAVLLVLSVNRFLLAGLSAALPHVVTSGELVMANSVSTTSGTIAAILGGGLGLGVRSLAGERDVAVLAVAALGYGLAGLVATRLRRDQLGPDDVPPMRAAAALGHVARGLTDGARHLTGTPAAWRALAVISAHRVWYGISTVMTILLARNYFNDPADSDAGLRTLALVFAASGLGFFAAAVLTPAIVGRRWSPSRYAGALLAMACLVELALGPAFLEPFVVVIAFFVGVTSQGVKICVDTVLQQAVADAYRGRVFSLYDMAFNVVFVAAAAVSALTLPSSGKSLPVLLAVIAGYGGTAVFVRRGGLPRGRVVGAPVSPGGPPTSGAARPGPPPAPADPGPGAARAGTGRPRPHHDRD